MSKALLAICLAALAMSVFPHAASAQQDNQLVLNRGGSTIVVEPYADNIVRVTLSLQKDNALSAPGYGFVDTPSTAKWNHEQTETSDLYRSSRLEVRIASDHNP
ncbi:MAG TPA: alpha-glucosidase, partial [Acidobacteriaceae bacterium]